MLHATTPVFFKYKLQMAVNKVLWATNNAHRVHNLGKNTLQSCTDQITISAGPIGRGMTMLRTPHHMMRPGAPGHVMRPGAPGHVMRPGAPGHVICSAMNTMRPGAPGHVICSAMIPSVKTSPQSTTMSDKTTRVLCAAINRLSQFRNAVCGSSC